MTLTIPDSLKGFVERQATAGKYADSDSFVSDLLSREANIFDRVATGFELPADEHFERRLEALLDEAELGAYEEVTAAGFDAMESEALDLIRTRRA